MRQDKQSAQFNIYTIGIVVIASLIGTPLAFWISGLLDRVAYSNWEVGNAEVARLVMAILTGFTFVISGLLLTLKSAKASAKLAMIGRLCGLILGVSGGFLLLSALYVWLS